MMKGRILFFAILLLASSHSALSHGMIRLRDPEAQYKAKRHLGDDADKEEDGSGRPENAKEVCEGLTSVVESGYPADKMTVTCHCNGILIPDPTMPGNFVPIQGKYSLVCRSDNFFTSPDGSVWWYMTFQADFDTRSLYQIRQSAKYVKGREYKEGRDFVEDFTMYFDREDPDRDLSCSAGLTGALGFQNSCQICAKLSNFTRTDDTIQFCYNIDCTNVNVGAITKGQYIESIEDTCKALPITDFSTQPFAATLGFLQEDVRGVFPEGGAQCVELIAKAFDKLGDDIECTCARVNGSYNSIGADGVGTSYHLSCRMPCVYGPNDGSVEVIKYYEAKYTKSSVIFRFEWHQWRYEYILGRDDSEVYRHARDDSGQFLPELCTAWQNDVACVSCAFTSYLSDKILLNCTNLPNGVHWNHTNSGSTTVGDWETTPLSARYRGDSICLRPVTENDALVADARTSAITGFVGLAPDGYTAYSTGGCIGRNELGVLGALSVMDCAEVCDANEACVSFEYSKAGTKCQLSTSCDRFSLTVDEENNAYMWYLKESNPPT